MSTAVDAGTAEYLDLELYLAARRQERAMAGGVDGTKRYLRQIGETALLTGDDERMLGHIVQDGIRAEAQLVTHGIMNMVGILPPMALDEMSDLVGMSHDGQTARNHFTRANLRLVVSIAKRYTIPEFPLDDCIQEGNLGLMHAVEKFDPDRGFKFSTYATWWIKQAISRAMRDKVKAIREPAHVPEEHLRIEEAAGRLTRKLGRPPKIEELVTDTGIKKARILELYELSERRVVSVHNTLGHESDDTLETVIPDSKSTAEIDEHVAKLDRDQLVSEIIDSIDNTRERLIVISRFGFDGKGGKTLEKVGADLGVTRERVRQILNKITVNAAKRPILHTIVTACGFDAKQEVLFMDHFTEGFARGRVTKDTINNVHHLCDLMAQRLDARRLLGLIEEVSAGDEHVQMCLLNRFGFAEDSISLQKLRNIYPGKSVIKLREAELAVFQRIDEVGPTTGRAEWHKLRKSWQL